MARRERGTRNFANISFDENDAKLLEESLNSLPVKMARTVRVAANKAAGSVVAKRAKSTTAFKDISGNLRRSIRRVVRGGYTETIHGKRRRVPGRFVSVRAGSTVARQPVLVEYGHGGPRPAPPHPFLEPAAEGAAKEAFAAAVVAARAEFRKLKSNAR